MACDKCYRHVTITSSFVTKLKFQAINEIECLWLVILDTDYKIWIIES